MFNRTILAVLVLLCASPAFAFEATLICSAHSGDRARMKAFQAPIQFKVDGGRLEGKRVFLDGEEVYSGLISSDGHVEISGRGTNKSGEAWVYEFTGLRAQRRETILLGKMTSTRGPSGGRACTLRF